MLWRVFALGVRPIDRYVADTAHADAAMDGITAFDSYMCTTGYMLQLGAGRSSVSTDAVIRSEVCDFIMRCIEVFEGLNLVLQQAL